jgi:hypothetical protein
MGLHLSSQQPTDTVARAGQARLMQPKSAAFGCPRRPPVGGGILAQLGEKWTSRYTRPSMGWPEMVSSAVRCAAG